MIVLFRSDKPWVTRATHGVVPDGGGPADAALRDGGPPREQAVPAGILDELAGLVGSIRATLSNVFDLLSLEAQRAVHTLMWMAIWAVVAAVCIVSAWLGLMTVLVLWAVALGVPAIGAVLGVAVLSGAAGALLIFLCGRMSHDLLFPATRRRLAGKPPAMPVAS